MAEFTHTQGRYLAFINAYTHMYGFPPAETDIAKALFVTPPFTHLMVRMLERKGLILRTPGQPRSIEIIIPETDIPAWNQHSAKKSTPSMWGEKRPPIMPNPSLIPSTFFPSIWSEALWTNPN